MRSGGAAHESASLRRFLGAAATPTPRKAGMRPRSGMQAPPFAYWFKLYMIASSKVISCLSSIYDEKHFWGGREIARVSVWKRCGTIYLAYSGHILLNRNEKTPVLEVFRLFGVLTKSDHAIALACSRNKLGAGRLIGRYIIRLPLLWRKISRQFSTHLIHKILIIALPDHEISTAHG